MTIRGTFYRCHLFTWAGPQSAGVLSQWTQNLAPIGDREVLSGELVELLVTVDTNQQPLSAEPRIRFDVLEEDFFLTGGLDDAVLSIVSEGASSPADDFPTDTRLRLRERLAAGDSVAERVAAFRREYANRLEEFILVLDGPSATETTILTWWATERKQDYLNSEFYFIVNVDDLFEDQSEQILDVSPVWAADDGAVAADDDDASEFAVIEADWKVATAKPGEEVAFSVVTDEPMSGFDATISVYTGLDGELVDQFDINLRGRPPYAGSWRVPTAPTARRYWFEASVLGLEKQSRKLEIVGDIDVYLKNFDSAFTTGFGHKAYRILDDSGKVVRSGSADPVGFISEKDLPWGSTWLEIDGAAVESISGEAEEPEPLLPLAAGRSMSFVFRSRPPAQNE